MNRLHTLDVKYIKGIGPARAELLASECEIHTAADLVRYYPTHYVDRSTVRTIRSISDEETYVQLRGKFVSLNIVGEGAKMRLTGLFSDGTGTIEVVWFKRIKSLAKQYLPGTEYIIFGKPGSFNGHRQMTHPEVDLPGTMHASEGLRGVYPLTEKLRNRGITSRSFDGWIQTVLSGPEVQETLPRSVLDQMRLPSLHAALTTIHRPGGNTTLDAARLRLKFEELFFIQLDIQRRARKRKMATDGFRFARIGSWFNSFYSRCLPFELTDAQKRVIKEIRADVNTGRQMNRLVQGDVGSGKTLVALMSMLIAVDNGYQACLMAPTEILATQHYETISKMTAPIGLNVALLKGSTRKAERERIHAGLADGSIHLLVGTHAVLEEPVTFRNLGMAVIDEQHRFGVAQRARLWMKNSIPPHILVMTATPIPRTLAMTVYGDLDVSVIDTLPPGRKPVNTVLRYDNQRLQVYKALYKQIQQGRQAYIVYPLIDENEKLDLRSLTEGYDAVREMFPMLKVAFVHGRMKPVEKDFQMQLFASGEAQILVATTVIEVGVNVPNASVMIIENAERFGLSQLHQLRGRVGRGADQSYCVLMSRHNISTETRKRLEIMTSTTDGFVVAEADMQMRGPGDIEGTMQSGLPFRLRIASLATDGQIIQLARNSADALLDSDPDLIQPQNAATARELRRQIKRQADWSRIS